MHTVAVSVGELIVAVGSGGTCDDAVKSFTDTEDRVFDDNIGTVEGRPSGSCSISSVSGDVGVLDGEGIFDDVVVIIFTTAELAE